MELKLYFTKPEIEKYLARKGYEIKFIKEGSSSVKKIFRYGKMLENERSEEIFRKLLQRSLLRL